MNGMQVVCTGDMLIAQSRIISKHVTDHACGVVVQTSADCSILICSWKQIGQEHCRLLLCAFMHLKTTSAGCDGVVSHSSSQF